MGVRPGEEPLTSEIRIDEYRVDDALVDDVRAGLSRPLKELPPKYFYDERGSLLFERITRLPEYYPTRCERSILNRHAPRIVDGCVELIELGCGTASKTCALLYAMAAAGTLRGYVPLDVDGSVVRACAVRLAALYPGLRVHGVIADFGRDLERVPDAGDGYGGRLFAFLAERSATSTRMSGAAFSDACARRWAKPTGSSSAPTWSRTGCCSRPPTTTARA